MKLKLVIKPTHKIELASWRRWGVTRYPLNDNPKQITNICIREVAFLCYVCARIPITLGDICPSLATSFIAFVVCIVCVYGQAINTFLK